MKHLMFAIPLLLTACGQGDRPKMEDAPTRSAGVKLAPEDRSQDLAGREQAAYRKVRPILDETCARCHAASGESATPAKLARFDISGYPFTGTKASTADLRRVLGIDGSEPSMPKGGAGAVQGEALAAFAAWADAYDAADQAGTH